MLLKFFHNFTTSLTLRLKVMDDTDLEDIKPAPPDITVPAFLIPLIGTAEKVVLSQKDIVNAYIRHSKEYIANKEQRVYDNDDLERDVEAVLDDYRYSGKYLVDAVADKITIYFDV